jgi:hypothetical protein
VTIEGMDLLFNNDYLGCTPCLTTVTIVGDVTMETKVRSLSYLNNATMERCLQIALKVHNL